MEIPRPPSTIHHVGVGVGVGSPPPELTPTEQEVLDEYEKLANNMKKLASLLDTLASNPTVEILDGLRELERKTSLVFTLLKASVYSIVLQQEMDWGGGGGGQQQGGQHEEEEDQ
ncbi:DASH complex subunit Dad3-domain-containing protein [Apiosordaria backusii]|uniref:DASH complex subunit DAD3 n=1 Tax=Apiosordaria backusii TaxID=314023 RepID=A0AA40EY62_9PEZI|nr:DASH complex subunit Dad3-domain-containing protein [Apiosordaria backusii]